jgi:hypothetical protein
MIQSVGGFELNQMVRVHIGRRKGVTGRIKKFQNDRWRDGQVAQVLCADGTVFFINTTMIRASRVTEVPAVATAPPTKNETPSETSLLIKTMEELHRLTSLAVSLRHPLSGRIPVLKDGHG